MDEIRKQTRSLYHSHLENLAFVYIKNQTEYDLLDGNKDLIVKNYSIEWPRRHYDERYWGKVQIEEVLQKALEQWDLKSVSTFTSTREPSRQVQYNDNLCFQIASRQV
ncbi:hypothetical protein OESDEN_13245 [Oesophagostomum dentatum]|uniref:Uncharacterized protein n=1 Tax=Oesophagostomum dentatum TaxID=61180 RepID=A0A0B1SPW1_OESDE|nr:hypothetical protein OESDEN_13245 [Oesophagostomum dentatum]